MNTLEERAKEYGDYQLAETDIDNEIWEQAYTQGAKEQQRNDIEKVCQWLRNNFYHEETMCDSIAYMHEDEDIDVMIEQFKKEMEDNL